MAASPSPDIDLARARLLVSRANQARKKSKGLHKGTKVTANKENEDLQAQDSTCTKKKAVSVVYIALYACYFQYQYIVQYRCIGS
jgi:hypothetical protein